MFNQEVSDWEIRYDESGATPFMVGIGAFTFEMRSKAAAISFGLKFFGLMVQTGLPFKRKEVDRSAQLSEMAAQVDVKPSPTFWHVTVARPFCANDLSYARGTISYLSPGALGDLAVPQLEGKTTVMRFWAHSKSRGKLFQHPSLGLPLNMGLLLPQGQAVIGYWDLK